MKCYKIPKVGAVSEGLTFGTTVHAVSCSLQAVKSLQAQLPHTKQRELLSDVLARNRSVWRHQWLRSLWARSSPQQNPARSLLGPAKKFLAILTAPHPDLRSSRLTSLTAVQGFLGRARSTPAAPAAPAAPATPASAGFRAVGRSWPTRSSLHLEKGLSACSGSDALRPLRGGSGTSQAFASSTLALKALLLQGPRIVSTCPCFGLLGRAPQRQRLALSLAAGSVYPSSHAGEAPTWKKKPVALQLHTKQ